MPTNVMFNMKGTYESLKCIRLQD